MDEKEVLAILDKSLEYLNTISDEEYIAKHDKVTSEFLKNREMLEVDFFVDEVEAYEIKKVTTKSNTIGDENIEFAA